MRKLGEAGVTLVGVYFAATSAIGIARLAAARELAATNLLPVATACVVACICLFAGRAIAAKLFADDTVSMDGLSRRDLLAVGLSMLGVSMALSGVPGLLQFAGRLLWYADGTRRAQFLPAMEQSWSPAANNLIELALGWGIASGAGKIAAKLDAPSS